MRLTLRTLLAYRDGVLSPADTEDLHRRIHQSQDAGNLLRRIGAVTQRSGVLAPLVHDKGLGGDANAIAEYLDDALPHGQIPELERICLVSDVQLAELADCHRLLATALNTKILVPSDLRETALRLGDPGQRPQILQEIEARKAPRRRSKRSQIIIRSDEAHAPISIGNHAPVSVGLQTPMLASGGGSIKPQGLDLESTALTHDVPEYLLGSSSGNWKLPLAIGALATLLMILLWQSLGPWDRITELFAKKPLRGDRTQTNAAPKEPDPKLAVPPTPVEPASADVPNNIETGNVQEANTETAQDELSLTNETPPGVAAESADNSAEVVAEPTSDAPLAVAPDSPTPEQAASDSTSDSAESPPKIDLTAEPQSSRMAVWLPSDQQAEAAVLLVRDGESLQRLEPGNPLAAGSRLIVPPFTRSTIDLEGGVLWTACGPSLIELTEGPPRTQDATPTVGPVVVTPLCRALVRGGPDGNQLHLSTPLGDYRLRLLLPGSLASVEVAYRSTQPGPLTDRQSTKPVLIIVAAEGEIEVSEIGGDGRTEQLSLADGVAVILGEQMNRFRLQSIPNWFRTSVDRPIDTLAIKDLHTHLAANARESKEVASQLSKLAQVRRPETAALAVQVSMLCGDWHPLAQGFLDDDRMRSHWTPTLELAGQLLASDPGNETALRASFTEHYGQAADELLTLLIGLPTNQIASGGLASIVQNLEGTQLAQRVLASYQMLRLTGKSAGFQPSNPSRSIIQQWRREIASDRLKPLTISTPIWESLPSGE